MRYWLFALILFAMLFPTTAQEETAVPAPPQEVALRLAGTTYPGTFDPLYATSVGDAQVLPNLFLGLTRIDPATGEPMPGLASTWIVSEDGLTWTFTLREDVQWMKIPRGSEVPAPVRPVTVDDVVFSVQRLCSSTENGYYATDVIAKRIAGCGEGQAAGDGSLAQISASENTVSITLTADYPYFDALAALWTLAPVPRDIVEQFGADWTLPQNILTSGAFGLLDDAPGEAHVLVANPAFPADLHGGGNVNRVAYLTELDTNTVFRLYREGNIDRTAVPAASVEAVFSDEAFTGETFEVAELSVFYLGFNTAKPPFDDPAVRRAFSAVIDQAAFVNAVRDGRGTPINHFIPAELAFSPASLLENLIGFDPDYARAQLADSAYPNCANLPTVTIYTYEGASGWAGYWVDAVVSELGCSRDAFSITRLEYEELRANIDPDTVLEARPNVFTFGFGADFNDASNFVDVLACGAENYFGFQTCGAVDELIQQANASADEAERASLYRIIEEAYFNRESGLAPMIPLFQLTRYIAVKPWLTGPYLTDERFGITYFDTYTIDTALRNEVLTCTITSLQDVNLRSGPGINTDLAGTLRANTSVIAVARTRGTDGFVWWLLDGGQYVREDVVDEAGYCNSLPPA